MLDLDWISAPLGARRARRGERIQSLWSGYGEIVRAHLEGGPVESVVVKHVTLSTNKGDIGHRRKVRSYEVEQVFYRSFSSRCDDACRVPRLFFARTAPLVLVLEDLDAAGFVGRRRADGLARCLSWLAHFHATFMGVEPRGLWKIGTYWHLATRPEELGRIDDDALRAAAPILDARLNACVHKTLVHGDAKLANFCFAKDGRVAAVDFQYVGGGCGMKDVAYLISGERDEARLLEHYFRELSPLLKTDVMSAVEAEWRALYPIACVDFYRFLAGWSPRHFETDAHARSLTRSVLSRL